MTSKSNRFLHQRIIGQRLAQCLLLLVYPLTCCVLVTSVAGQESQIDSEVDIQSHRVIADYIEAIGGEMRIDSIDSFKIIGQYGKEGSMTDFQLLVVGENCILEYGNVRNIGTRLHKWNLPNGGEASLDASIPYQETFPLLTIAFGWNDYPGKISYVGEDFIDDKPVEVLLFQPYGQAPHKRFFDKGTGLMIAQHVNNFFQRFEYTELEDLQVIKRQVLYSANGDVHQILEYETTLDVKFDKADFVLPEGIKGELKEQLEKRIEKGLVEPEEGKLQILGGDGISFKF